MLNEAEMQEIEKRAMDALNAPGSERQEQRFAPDPAPQSELTQLAVANQTAQLRIAQLVATVRELQLRAELDGDDLPLRDKLEMAEGVIASQLERMAGLQRQVREYRGLLLWALYHHQGGTSHVGLPIRRAIGIGEYDRMSAEQIAEAKRVVSSRAAITKDQTHD